ncbi:MAG: hypothetical protein Q7R60_00375 [bacterium]|nr:hypothetical protein [bacterium]
MKKMSLVLSVLFVLVAFVLPVSAQCFENSELGRVMAGPCVQHSIWRVRAGVNEAINIGGYSGVGGGSVGIGGGRVGRDIGAGLLGAAVGGAFGGRKGALIGGAAGVGAAELFGSLAKRRSGGHAAAGPSAGGRGGQGGEFELSNSTRYSVDVYRRDQKGREKYLGRLASGDASIVEAPKPGETYHGYVLIPNNAGGLSSDRIFPAPTTDGWEFREPPEAMAQGGGRR